MKTKSPLFRIDRLLVAALALLAAPHVEAQTTYLYTNTASSGTWMTVANWQTNGVTSTTAPSNNTTAVVRFTNSGAITMGVNLNQSALGNTVSVGSLLKENSGNLTMNNSSGTVSGTFRVFGSSSGSDTNLIVTLGTGALIITNGSQLMDLQLATGGIINVSNSGGRVVLASLIKEDAGETNTITKTGAGTLVISGTNVNTWGGGIVLNAGVLQLNKSSALGSASGLGLTINGGSLDNGSGGAITLSNYAQTWGADFTFIGTTNLNLGAGAVNLTGTRTVTVSARALTVGGTITNAAGGITKAGAGTLILNGANTYAGATTVNAGTLSLGNVNALQNSILDTGTAGTQVVSFTVGGANTYNLGGLQGSDDLDNNGNTLSVGSSGGNTTYAGTLSGSGALIKAGAGTLTLTSAGNSYSGGTTINAGAVEITGANRLGNVNGALTINDGKLLVTTAGLSSGRNISLGDANSTIEVASGITYTATNTSVVSGSGRLNKTGLGVLALYGTNTYSGGTVVSAGTLAGDTAGVRGAITNNATVNFVTTTNGTYSGAMTGTGALTKSGAATLTTTGINDFSGATTISAGALFVNGTNANSAVAVNSTGTIGGSGSVGATTINSGGTMNPGNSPGTQTYSSLIWEGGGNYNWQLHDASGAAGTGYDTFVSTGAFTINATSGNKFNINLWTLSGIGPDTNGSAINFTNTSDYTWTLGSFGSISGFATNAFSINTASTNGTSGFANLFSGTFSVTTNSTQLLLVYTAPVVSSVYTWNTTDGLWSVGANWAGSAAPSNTSSIVFAGASGGVSTNDSQVSEISSLTFSNTAGSYTINGTAFTNGVSGVVNNSTSAQTINNDITLGGAQIFDAAAGSLTFGGAIDNNGNLFTVTGASNTVLNGIVSGNGGLTKSGNGSLTLGGNNTYTGALSANAGTVLVNGTQATTTVNVSGGTLRLGGDNVLADGATLTLSIGTVDFGGFGDTVTTFNQSGGVSTNGTITATTYGLSGGTVGGTLGTGTANVTGSVTLSGAVNSTLNINIGGTLTLAANDRIGNSSAVTVNAGTLATATFTDTVGSLVLTNSGSITGTGTVTAATYTLNGGTVSANLGAGTATSSAGSTTLSGTLAGDLSVAGGTLTLGANDRISGSSAVTVSSGTLNFGGFTDSVGSFALNGGVFTNGTVTTTTYTLTSGTMGGTLGAGTANVSGAVTLSGLINSTLNVNTGGTLTLAAADRIDNASAVTVDAGALATATFSDTVGSLLLTNNGSLTGSGTITAGTYTLNGGTVSASLGAGTANVSSGTTTLNGSLAASTVNIDGGTLALGGNGRIDNAAVVNLSSGALDMGTFIDGVGTFNMTGGSVNGTGANSLTAINGLNLQAGTINANIGNSTVAISNGTTTINGTVGGAVTVSSGTANLGGALNSSLTASGGTANLSNTVAGNVTVSGGTMNLGAADLIGNASTVNVSSGALNLNGNDSVGAVTVSGGTVGGSGVLTGSSYALQGGTISTGLGGAGAMTKSGVGTATLSANNTTTFSGAVAVNSGALLATTTGALGTGAVTITNGSTLAANGVTLANNFTIGVAGGFGSTTALQSWDFTGFSNNATLGSTFTNSSLATDVALNLLTRGSGAAASTANNSFRTTGFQNNGIATNNTDYFEWKVASGSTNMSLRTLDARFNGTGTFVASPGVTNQFAWSTNGSDFNLISSPFNITGTNVAMPQLDLSGIAALQNLATNTTVTFRFYASGQTTTGGYGFFSPGAGTNGLSLGGAFFQAGGSGSGTLGIDQPGSATFSGTITNNNAATLTAASGGLATFSGIVSGEGSVTKTGEGTVTLSGANSYSGGTLISAGVLSVGDGGASGSITGPTTNNASLVFNRSDNFTHSGAISGSGVLSKSGLGTMTLSGSNTYSGGTLINAGAVVGSSTSISGPISNNATVVFDQSSFGRLSNVISGSGALVKQSAGTLVLAASNTYSGETTITGGTLAFTKTQGANFTNRITLNSSTNASPATLGLIGGVNIANDIETSENEVGGILKRMKELETQEAGGTLGSEEKGYISGDIIMRSSLTIDVATNGLDISGIMSGAGALIKDGDGTATLTGSNSYTNTTTLSAGTLTLSNASGAALGYSSAVNIASGATLLLGLADQVNNSSAITNNGGTFNLGTYSDTIGVYNQVAGMITNGSLTASAFNVQSGSVAAVLAGAGSLTKSGSGTVILSGANTYSGGTLISAGALLGSTTSLQGLITNNAAVLFDQSSEGTYSGVMSGGGSLTKLGSGTVILTGSNAYTGSTYINAGALAFGETQDNTFTNRIYLGATSGSSNATLIISNGVTLANDITVQAGSTGQNTLKHVRELAVQNGSETLAGDVALEREVIVDADAGGLVLDGLVSGVGSMVKIGAGSVTLSASNSYAGGTTLSNGVLRLTSANAAGSGAITQSSGASTLQIDTTGTVANAMSIFNIRTLQTVTLSGNKTLNNATYTVDSGTTTTESGVLSGSGGITKEGAGSLVVTASNSFTGATVVNAGTLNLNSSTGSALGASTNVTVGATLLISQSNQINDSAAVTLSGGTIRLGGDVSEAFSSLNLTTGSFLDFGSGTASSLSFGTYEENATPSALLTLDNFIPGNSFTFSNALFAADGSNIGSYFTFGTGFVDRSITDNGGNSFTITAIPEPSTYLAAAGLLGLMLWPSRKRLIKDAKKILGLRAPMRDRLASKRI